MASSRSHPLLLAAGRGWYLSVYLSWYILNGVNEFFRKVAHKASALVGTAWAFTLAATIIMLWAVSGWFFDFSDSWQLVINTGTTILTFLMVFLIQNTQNRDARAVHLKLDELIKSTKAARNALIDLEDMSDKELDELQSEFEKIRESKERFH